MLDELSTGTTGAQEMDSLIQDIAENDVEIMEEQSDDIPDLEKVAGESPVIRFVNYLIANSVKEGASDIHIEPGEHHFKVRYRIDGIMFEAMRPPQSLHPAVVSRLKIMSNMDISERRLPQDGRIQAMINGRHIDLRVSTLPLTSGGRRRSSAFWTTARSSSGWKRWAWKKTRWPSSSTRSIARTASSWSPGRPARARPPRCTRRCGPWTAPP